MLRGQHISVLSPQDAALLNPINWRNGNKRNALLLLHGFGSTPAVFRRLLENIQGYDAILAPPLPGHAVSLNEFSAMKSDKILNFVETICADLCQEFEQVDVVGLSYGGVLACHLSSLFPLHHLYLLAPALDIHLAVNTTLKLAKFLHKLGFRYLRNLGGNLRSSVSCEIALRQLPITAVIESLEFIKHFEFKPPTCPTDLFLGRYDEVVSSNCVAARFEPIENTTIHWLENSAHVLPLDEDRHVINQLISQNMEVPVINPSKLRHNKNIPLN
jgi:carboxylesterase